MWTQSPWSYKLQSYQYEESDATRVLFNIVQIIKQTSVVACSLQ